jgi:hypothetical protein
VPRWSTCHDYLISPYSPVQSSNLDETTTYEPSCDVKAAQEYRVKAKIECNFEKIRQSLKTSHVLIVGNSFQVRTVSYGPFIRGHYYHISLTRPIQEDMDVYAFGDNLQYNDRVLYLEEGDCPEGGFMEFVVDKVHLLLMIFKANVYF